jgi:hypothetical protein
VVRNAGSDRRGPQFEPHSYLDGVELFIFPIVTAVVTSGALVVVVLFEAPRSVPLVSKEGQVVATASQPSIAQPSVMISVVDVVRVLVGLGLLAGLVLFAQGFAYDRELAESARARAEREGRFSGVWKGSYTSERFGGGSAELELVPTGETDIKGTWSLKPAVPLGKTAGPEVSIRAGSGRLQGTSVNAGSRRTLALTLSPHNPKNRILNVAMTVRAGDGVSNMRGTWGSADCAVAVSGEIAFSG